MKKYFFLFFLFLILSPAIYSQVIQNYGFKVGYVNSSESFNNSIDNTTKRKSGFSISGFIDLFGFHGFSISPEVKFIQKGVGLEFFVTGPESPEPIGKRIEYIYHNYLSIPVSIMYTIPLNFGNSFVKLAPRYDILIKSYDDFNSPASTYDNYKNVFGGTVSVGFIPALNSKVNPFLEISYHMDFTDTFSSPRTNTRNNAFEVNLGILL